MMAPLVMNIVNLTPHAVTVYAAQQPIAVWPPSGLFARLDERRHEAGPLETDQGVVPVMAVGYTEQVLDLPPMVSGTAYVVSRVLAARVGRPDLYFPFDEVRDAQTGQIIGCRALGRFEDSDAQ